MLSANVGKLPVFPDGSLSTTGCRRMLGWVSCELGNLERVRLGGWQCATPPELRKAGFGGSDLPRKLWHLERGGGRRGRCPSFLCSLLVPAHGSGSSV